MKSLCYNNLTYLLIINIRVDAVLKLDFSVNLERSNAKYKNLRRMFDAQGPLVFDLNTALLRRNNIRAILELRMISDGMSQHKINLTIQCNSAMTCVLLKKKLYEYMYLKFRTYYLNAHNGWSEKCPSSVECFLSTENTQTGSDKINERHQTEQDWKCNLFSMTCHHFDF